MNRARSCDFSTFGSISVTNCFIFEPAWFMSAHVFLRESYRWYSAFLSPSQQHLIWLREESPQSVWKAQRRPTCGRGMSSTHRVRLNYTTMQHVGPIVLVLTTSLRRTHFLTKRQNMYKPSRDLKINSHKVLKCFWGLFAVRHRHRCASTFCLAI